MPWAWGRAGADVLGVQDPFLGLFFQLSLWMDAGLIPMLSSQYSRPIDREGPSHHLQPGPRAHPGLAVCPSHCPSAHRWSRWPAPLRPQRALLPLGVGAAGGPGAAGLGLRLPGSHRGCPAAPGEAGRRGEEGSAGTAAPAAALAAGSLEAPWWCRAMCEVTQHRVCR